MLEQKQAANMQEVQVSMFKKALDMNSEGALALINAATQAATPAASNPPNLGQNIDVKA
ncbi:MAG: YjfB family protein [Gammaproteobacteria bacterium]|nr:YjfB family protein [Gammaproteobacteria bacterium]